MRIFQIQNIKLSKVVESFLDFNLGLIFDQISRSRHQTSPLGLVELTKLLLLLLLPVLA